MSSPVLPTGHDEIQRDEAARLFGAFVRFRLYVMPIPCLALSALAFTDASTWRRAVIVAVVGSIAALSVFERLRSRRSGTYAGTLEGAIARARFARTSITESRSSRSTCRRCASGWRTSPSSRAISSSASPSASAPGR